MAEQKHQDPDHVRGMGVTPLYCVLCQTYYAKISNKCCGCDLMFTSHAAERLSVLEDQSSWLRLGNARLVGLAKRALPFVRDAEWSGAGDRCPSCGAWSPNETNHVQAGRASGHARDCELAAVIKELEEVCR